MNPRFIALLAAASYAAGAAHGAESFAIGTSDVHFSVIDLTPDDGVAAGFDVVASSAWLAARANLGPNWPFQQVTVPGDQAATVHVEAGGVQLSVSSDGMPGNVRLAYVEPDNNLSGGGFYGYSWLYATITVHANTLLLVDGNTFAELAGWSSVTARRGHIGIELSGLDGTLSNSWEASFGNDNGPDGIRPFQLAYANVTGTDATLELAVNSQIVLVPVPEPSTYAMFAGGLVAAAAFARRRQQAGKA